MTTSEAPLQFADTLCVNSAFPLPAHRARALLPSPPPLNLVEVFPGRAVLVVSFSRYRESPFGDYAEAVLALMATHERTTPTMTLARLTQESRYPGFVLHMFVNSPQAQQFGVAWGLPRTLADVQVVEEHGQTICTVTLDQQQVMQINVERPRTDRQRSMQMETYSLHEGTLLHATMHCEANAYGRQQGGGATLIWGDHPLARSFVDARISPQPLMVRYYDQMQASLAAPQPTTPEL